MKLLSAVVLLLSTPVFAGTWTCDTGLDGKQIMRITVRGDEQGLLVAPAKMVMMNLPTGATVGVMADKAEADELSRTVVGYEDPRSKTRLRIMKDPVSPNVYTAHTLLVNMGIKQEMDGTCAYAP